LIVLLDAALSGRYRVTKRVACAVGRTARRALSGAMQSPPARRRPGEIGDGTKRWSVRNFGYGADDPRQRCLIVCGLAIAERPKKNRRGTDPGGIIRAQFLIVPES
jgi:hypothetical protein